MNVYVYMCVFMCLIGLFSESTLSITIFHNANNKIKRGRLGGSVGLGVTSPNCLNKAVGSIPGYILNNI